jgi:nicotinamide phosphoribosyltransferase
MVMTNLRNNLILNLVDSYKTSHFGFMETGTTEIFSYIESRAGSEYKETLFFGLQYFLKEYMQTPITMEMVDQAEKFLTAHGEPFNRTGWEYIVNNLKGKIPLQVRAVPEGTIVTEGNVLVTFVNTDPNCAWVTGYFETAFLRAVWYPSTVATRSFNIKRTISSYLQRTGSIESLPFKMIDFGARGVSSLESSMLGGAAHLVNFLGTDNISGIICSMDYYYSKEVTGFSIPASEHSVTTAWGKNREADFFSNAIDVYGGPGKLISLVADSYSLENAIKIIGTTLKQKIIDNGCTIVVRPDSGDPASMVLVTVRLLDQYFGCNKNAAGYNVLHNSVRVIQGDGITIESIKEILDLLEKNGYSADNVTFGCGGYLLQQLNRDTQRFAMKASSVVVGGDRRNICKTPKTDMSKQSKSGRLAYVKFIGQDIKRTITVEQFDPTIHEDLMETVYRDGEILKVYTFDEVRANATKSL